MIGKKDDAAKSEKSDAKDFGEKLKDIFLSEPAWFDSTGAGHYVMRRRVRTWAKAASGVCAAALAAFMYFCYYGREAASVPAPAREPQPAATAAAEHVSPGGGSEATADMENAAPSGPRLIAVAPLESFPPDLPAPSDAGDSKPRQLLAFVPEGVEQTPLIEIEVESAKEEEEKEESDPVRQAPAPKTPAAQGPGRNAPSRRNPYWIRVNKSDYTLSLYNGDNLVKTYSVAVGQNPGDKQRVGDHRTPVGDFRVVSIEDASKWKHDFGDGKGKISGAYGPWFIRLDAGGWKGIGIHGTHDPDSRGTMATEGCIRLSNEEIQDLRRYAYRNMRVVIEE